MEVSSPSLEFAVGCLTSFSFQPNPYSLFSSTTAIQKRNRPTKSMPCKNRSLVCRPWLWPALWLTYVFHTSIRSTRSLSPSIQSFPSNQTFWAPEDTEVFNQLVKNRLVEVHFQHCDDQQWYPFDGSLDSPTLSLSPRPLHFVRILLNGQASLTSLSPISIDNLRSTVDRPASQICALHQCRSQRRHRHALQRQAHVDGIHPVQRRRGRIRHL